MSNQQERDLSLKQYAIEKAIESGSIDNMQKIYDFLIPDVTIQKDKDTNITRIVHKKLHKLTPAQRQVLFYAVKLSNEGEQWLNGATIGRAMKKTPGLISFHMLKLIKHGYIQREGHRLYVCYLANGERYAPTIKKYPAGAAQGYKMQDIIPDDVKTKLANAA